MLNALVHIEVDTIILDRKKQKLDDTLEGAGYKQAKEKFKQPQTKSGQISETLYEETTIAKNLIIKTMNQNKTNTSQTINFFSNSPYLVNQYQEGKYPDLQKSQLEPDSKSGMDILDKTIQVKNHENKTQDMETMSNGTIEEDVNKTPSIL
ncbi:hypothetical protein C2G38_2037432 [Gigaspora rosea]|uniref:Uncharacterized protein n=1 Tax=Gigaspora rosea TaxID=44941 RepID=A0A397V794_9GLOM|nr:hypothetical protein C2G38_2037432 [Gigaspora rosea]